MSIEARLDKLVPALSVRQRVSLILRAQNAGEEPDRHLMELKTLDERREYDHFAAMIIAVNHELGTVVRGLRIVASDLEARVYDVELLDSAAVLVAQQEGTPVPPKAVRNWRKLKQVESATFFASVAGDIRRQLQEQVDFRWQEMRAIQIIWAELAARFDGEDPRHPEIRQDAEEVADLLQDVARRLAGKQRRLPEPTEAMVADMRGHVDAAFGHFNLKVTWP